MWQPSLSGPRRLPSPKKVISLKALLLGAAVIGLAVCSPVGGSQPWAVKTAWAADEEPPPPPPLPDEDGAGIVDDEAGERP